MNQERLLELQNEVKGIRHVISGLSTSLESISRNLQELIQTTTAKTCSESGSRTGSEDDTEREPKRPAGTSLEGAMPGPTTGDKFQQDVGSSQPGWMSSFQDVIGPYLDGAICPDAGSSTGDTADDTSEPTTK